MLFIVFALIKFRAVSLLDIFRKEHFVSSGKDTASRTLKEKKLAMNVTESKEGSLIKMCPMNEMVWKQEYQVEKIALAMTAIILNVLSFPVTILMNVLVIMAVKTRPRLQSKYNILLACLAGTDLLVGARLHIRVWSWYRFMS